MSYDENNFKEFSVRIPIEIFKKIESDCLNAKPKRSKNNQVNFIIETYYDLVENQSIHVPVNEVATTGD